MCRMWPFKMTTNNPNLILTGAECTSDIDECESNPCQNGAACTDAVNGYTCQCRDGYEGKTRKVVPLDRMKTKENS